MINRVKLLVDGVFFQLASSGIARVWSSVLPRLAERNNLDVFVLDRGGFPKMAGVTVVPFPSYVDRYTADDSFLLQRMCDHLQINVFTSTYYTSPVSTPMVLVLYDMIPEIFGFELNERFWREKEIAISFARKHVAISENTRNDLLRFYPELMEKDVSVGYPGVDRAVFRPIDEAEVQAFRERIGFPRPYFLLVGSREQHRGYKNTKLFFEALSTLDRNEVDVLCMGGEEEISDEVRALLPEGVRIARRTVEDEELALAYSGAVALVYPSLYEGFGLPVVEAMASGCPVITTTNGSLKEIVSESCSITVDAQSLPQMIAAIREVQLEGRRTKLVEAGLVQAKKFSWDSTVDALETALLAVAGEHKAGAYEDFFATWRRLREIQSSVDVQTLG
jgi:glycosyltransferase involved in cell wall biosynthesis